MHNVYREAFVFECALADRKFYLPKDGEMKLQFFHFHDLCRFIVVEKQAAYEYVYGDIEQRNYFCIYDYEYYLDVSEQYKLMHDVKPISVGLREALD